MSNRRTHRDFGGLAGVLFAATAPTGDDPVARAAGLAVGFAGGSIGGMLPDFCEPPRGPRHRSFFHSVFFLVMLGAGVMWMARRTLSSASQRHQPGPVAAAPRPVMRARQTPLYQLVQTLFGSMAAGVISHCILDAHTPAGLPLV